ncbi:hypothetical protein B296_00033570 [Ensete ventricosum]|uniref:3,4-dihydroxy-2-butanone-4-phosphate synthase n=1 Tax=Ensete ventricosum TaxID=4639 RepID=A0A426YGF9_ENSVE|nr:hypothetical protein B296_00033570 [Ensete ventricosum]
MGGGCIVVEATIRSSTEPLLPSRVSYAYSLSRAGDKLRSFGSYLRWMCVNQSDVKHAMVSYSFKELKGLCYKAFVVNQRISNFTSTGFGKAVCFSLKADDRFTAVPRSSESDIFPGESAVVEQDNATVNSMVQADAVALGTMTADMASVPDDFSIDNDENDLDGPTEGFSSISEAIKDICQGKFVIAVDDEDRENEGDLIMAASLVTPEAMAFVVKHGTGIDAKHGTTTGVSARDRAKTVMMLASADSKPADFNRPGHIFPLKYREGGVLKRAGHTEASVDLAILAGLPPVGVLCEIVDDDDGSMARLPKLREFAKKENLKIISIADLIRYDTCLSLIRYH